MKGWSWHHRYLGDILRRFVYESGPVSRQRWLHRERRFRTSASVTEVIIAVSQLYLGHISATSRPHLSASVTEVIIAELSPRESPADYA